MMRIDAGAGTKGHRHGITVYKRPGCACCARWLEDVRARGFTVDVRDVDDLAAVKVELAVPNAMWSCHMGIVGGYLVEGHVPVELIERLLRDRPTIRGLAVPERPADSPNRDARRAGSRHVFALGLSGIVRGHALR